MEQLVFVKTLVKKGEKANDKEIAVYQHKNSEKYVIKIETKDNPVVYETLKLVNSKYFPEIYGVYENGDGYSIIEEYIDGYSVEDVLKNGLYTKKGTKKLIKEVCCALKILHDLGIIHRDIKPANIMINKHGDVKLIDFDASKIYKKYGSSDTTLLGTTGYAAPEQFGFAQSDMRTDIYALGILMNVMLTGEHPSKKMYKGSLSKVIEKCIHVNPEKRFSSVEELYNKL